MSTVIGNLGNALQLTIPVRADNNWDAVMQAALLAITAHNHDGLQNGAQISIGALSITNAQLALMAGNTVKMNNTGSSAAPQDVSTTNAFIALFETKATTLGDLIYGGASGTPTRLAGDTSNTRKFLRELSSGAVATAPAWDTIAAGDLPLVGQGTAGAVSAAGQQLGINTNVAATAGNVGEVIRVTRLRSAAAALTSPNPLNVTTTSITLTAGDWNVSGMVGFLTGTATSVTDYQMSISKTSATLSATDTQCVPTAGEVRIDQDTAANVIGTAADISITAPPYQVTVANGNTVVLFLVAKAVFSASTLSVYGSLEARRTR